MAFRDCPVVVAGANGFLGCHLVRGLAAAGAHVTALVRPTANLARLDAIEGPVVVERVQLHDAVGLAAAITRANPAYAVIATGDVSGRRGTDARSLRTSLDANVGGTLGLLEALLAAAPQIRRVARLGSLEEYGDGPQPAVETQREAPVSAYSASQAAATLAAHTLCRAAGLPLVTLRPALVFGPGQSEDFFIPATIGRCLRNEEVVIQSDGSPVRELLFVDDFVAGTLAALTCEAADHEIINLGSGVRTTVCELAEAIREAACSKAEIRFGAGARASDLPAVTCDSAKSRRLLGWQATSSLAAGLEYTVQWHRRTLDVK